MSNSAATKTDASNGTEVNDGASKTETQNGGGGAFANAASEASSAAFFGQHAMTELPAQQAFEATGFMEGNNDPNLDFLGQVGGVYDAINFPEGLLDFGAWANFFSTDPNIPPDGDSGAPQT